MIVYLGEDEGDDQDHEEHAETPQGESDQQTERLQSAQRILWENITKEGARW